MKNYLKPKTKSRTKEQFSPIGQIAETSTRYPDISGIFLIFFKAKASILSEKLSDYGITRPRGTWRDTVHSGLFLYWAVFACSCCIRDWTAPFAPSFGLFQVVFEIYFVSFVPKLHFFSSKSRRLLVTFRPRPILRRFIKYFLRRLSPDIFWDVFHPIFSEASFTKYFLRRFSPNLVWGVFHQKISERLVI